MFDWNSILYPVIVALTTAVTSMIVYGIKKLCDYLKNKINNEIIDKYIGVAENIIANSVATISNGYVDNLKKEGLFDAEAQKNALGAALNLTKSQLTKDTVDIISGITSDLDSWITAKIEKDIVDNKKS